MTRPRTWMVLLLVVGLEGGTAAALPRPPAIPAVGPAPATAPEPTWVHGPDPDTMRARRAEALAAMSTPRTQAAWYRREAGRGDVWAQRSLAECFASGRGVVRSPAQAAGWYARAARAGDPEAAAALGDAFLTGTGVVRSYRGARRWYLQAAAAGTTAEPLFRLGVLAERGLGGPRSVGDAAAWYLAAARLGHREACFRIGLCFERGLGVPASPATAATWYAAAAAGPAPPSRPHAGRFVDWAFPERDGRNARAWPLPLHRPRFR